jgi:hypothetical protein
MTPSFLIICLSHFRLENAQKCGPAAGSHPPSPMSTTTETEPRAERAAEGEALVLFALIKSSSKYAYQGRYTGKPVAMRVTFLEAGEYAFHLENGNRYRREDLTFYVRGFGGKLIKLR